MQVQLIAVLLVGSVSGAQEHVQSSMLDRCLPIGGATGQLGWTCLRSSLCCFGPPSTSVVCGNQVSAGRLGECTATAELPACNCVGSAGSLISLFSEQLSLEKWHSALLISSAGCAHSSSPICCFLLLASASQRFLGQTFFFCWPSLRWGLTPSISVVLS